MEKGCRYDNATTFNVQKLSIYKKKLQLSDGGISFLMGNLVVKIKDDDKDSGNRGYGSDAEREQKTASVAAEENTQNTSNTPETTSGHEAEMEVAKGDSEEKIQKPPQRIRNTSRGRSRHKSRRKNSKESKNTFKDTTTKRKRRRRSKRTSSLSSSSSSSSSSSEGNRKKKPSANDKRCTRKTNSGNQNSRPANRDEILFVLDDEESAGSKRQRQRKAKRNMSDAER
ncbi:Hypothetical protein CINCED_3A022988 [Cinara cedri]|uniref:Uncharacterized protein n=1 Tax=Cinara cedri TaxID=506608 RepID=A0A5E4N2G1_9HEMI|nr:Hypothetical protein CINCED_3A022988 [Cinara cedri]